MNLRFERLSNDHISLLQNLFELYAYDLTEFNEMDINSNGLYSPPVAVKQYCHDLNFYSYIIIINEKIAGFIVVRKMVDENIYYLNHFFVLKKYRNKKVGQKAAYKLFKMLSGKWRVYEFDRNIQAQNFWRKVIDRYTDGNFVDERSNDGKGYVQEFNT